MSEQMDRAGFERRDEARHIRNVLLHGEIVALSVPMFGPAMPEAQGDRPVVPAERRHLSRPLTVVAERAMDEKQGRAGPALDERHDGAVHPESRHQRFALGQNGVALPRPKGLPAVPAIWHSGDELSMASAR